MSKRHLKLMAAPKSWPVKRKEKKWITRPNPGAHKLKECMPISLVLRLLKYAKTSKETKTLLNQGNIIVNDKKVKEPKFPVGLFDVIHLSNKETYRLLLDKKGKFTFNKVPKEEENIFLYKVINKTLLKNKKLQLNFHNGFNLLVDETKYKSNDILILENNKVKEHLAFAKGSLAFITKGKHLGELAKIEGIYNEPPLNKLVLLSIQGKKINLPKSYIFVIGKNKPLLTLK